MNTPKTTSRRRQEASRRNGALSRGPVTPEGKARSSRNAVTHGCCATLLTFTPEDASKYEASRATYVAHFQPRDQVERDLVEQIVHSNWQMQQCWIKETTLEKVQAIDDAESVDAKWNDVEPHFRQALGFDSAVRKSNAIPNLQRYQRGLALQADRAVKLLQQLQKLPLPPAEEPGREPVEPLVRNEPTPISEHTVCASVPDPAPVPTEPPVPACGLSTSVSSSQPAVLPGPLFKRREKFVRQIHSDLPRGLKTCPTGGILYRSPVVWGSLQ